jgi:hypothetical protein
MICCWDSGKGGGTARICCFEVTSSCRAGLSLVTCSAHQYARPCSSETPAPRGTIAVKGHWRSCADFSSVIRGVPCVCEGNMPCSAVISTLSSILCCHLTPSVTTGSQLLGRSLLIMTQQKAFFLTAWYRWLICTCDARCKFKQEAGSSPTSHS